MVSETLEEIQSRHKKENKELQNKLTALKKTATKGDKKKKKEVQVEMAQLEQEVQQRHEQELKDFMVRGDNGAEDRAEEIPEGDNGIQKMTENLTIEDAGNVENTPTVEGKGKKNRSKARKDRKAAKILQMQQEAEEEAATMDNVQEREKIAFDELLQTIGFSMKEVTADGHCLYNAVADQLNSLYNIKVSYGDLRKQTAEYLSNNKADFLPFMTNNNGDMMSDDEFNTYCDDLKNTAVWGGQQEIVAMSKVYQVPIYVYQVGIPTLKISEEIAKEPLRISYHLHAFGLGEHYNSLHKKTAA
ncbi:OTU-domain-containing protein [Basidiobolus meristosporus CBS 931.73]|uniref:OTU-domain-containing protein n=1 Tax=Basidiobolus meristosporus CBS 931.73 TaxID=1314790 RepID=A0A1Y1YVX7_9FUNG|nr:OTU-domain-containing protein [Basidiobolus meristosporus CBS 931.73]|eukprot:ORY02096.1 OTU-domain-containing protein [Basidiobolus meristosporus CBS 931.73]